MKRGFRQEKSGNSFRFPCILIHRLQEVTLDLFWKRLSRGMGMNRVSFRIAVITLFFCLVVPGLRAQIESPPLQIEADSVGYRAKIVPFIATFCAECHLGAKIKGDLHLDERGLPNHFLDPAIFGKWREVANALNSHTMPPKKARQPTSLEVAEVVDWITTQTVHAERTRKLNAVVLRRLNREEYRNTIRDLVGLDFDSSSFPQDPPAGGFDNNGSALTTSPLHVEMYLAAAREILDRALVEGILPPVVKWRFIPKVGDIDRTRLRLDQKNNPIVNGGNNRKDGKFVVVHHESWDKAVGARDFRVPIAGSYLIRVRAAGIIPMREVVVRSAETILGKRRDEENAKNPGRAKFHQEQFARDLRHFQTDPIYDYGPPRTRLALQLGPQPRTVAEFDMPATPEQAEVYEFKAHFTTESAGVSFEYAYNIPKVLENFWMQGRDGFARPEMLVEWFEIEGPIIDSWPPATHSGILFESTLRETDESLYAREVLVRFLRRAYRRPVTPDEINAKLRQYEKAKADGATLVQAIKRPLTAVLCSPNFLFLAEPKSGGVKGVITPP